MMNKAKTFNLGVVSSTHSLRSKPRPFLGGCSTRQRQRKYHQYPHDTVRIWGIERKSRKIPSAQAKSWGLALFVSRCMCVYTNIYVYVYTYICIYMYTHTYTHTHT